jgi:hypothetical protein
VTPEGRATGPRRVPTQCPDATSDTAADDFDALLEASTVAGPVVDRVRRLTPPDVCERIQSTLDGRPVQGEADVDRAVIHLVRVCRLHPRPAAFACILRSLVERDALRDVRPEVAQDIVSAAFIGRGRPPAVVVDACLAVFDTGRIGEDLAARFALLLAPEDTPRETPPDHGGDRTVRPLADVVTLRISRREACGRTGQPAWRSAAFSTRRPRGAERTAPGVFRGGPMHFGNVVGPAVLAGWSRTLQLAVLTVPLLLLAFVGVVLFWLQLRPERWLGAAAWAAGTAAAGRVGWRWTRRRWARHRMRESPHPSPR